MVSRGLGRHSGADLARGNLFVPGPRIRLDVSSSKRVDVNSNTSEAIGRGGRWWCTNTVFHERGRESGWCCRVILAEVSREG